jgi:hypothetical protein
MKKYLLGFIAVVMAISMSAYTAPKKVPVKNKKGSWDLWWFLVKPGYGTDSGFDNYSADFLTISPYMPEYICFVWPWLYKCTIGFDDIDIDLSTNKLKPGLHFPVAIGELRPDF